MKNLVQYITEALEQRALIVINPGFLDHSEQILNEFKESGWELSRIRTTKLLLSQAHKLYVPHKDQSFYEDLCKYMSSGPCTAAVLVHPGDPDADYLNEISEIKNEIRKRWPESDMRNVLHSTDDPQRLDTEIGVFF